MSRPDPSAACKRKDGLCHCPDCCGVDTAAPTSEPIPGPDPGSCPKCGQWRKAGMLHNCPGDTAASPSPPDGGYVVPSESESDDDGFRVRCEEMDGPLPCSKPAGHSGPHYFYMP